MPAKVIRPGPGTFGADIPPAVQLLLHQLALTPATTAIKTAADPMLESLGKPISELLDMVLHTTKKAPGLPRRVKLTEWNAGKGMAGLRPESQAQGSKALTSVGVEPAPFEASPADLDALISGGVLEREQPPTGAVDRIFKRLMAVLGQSQGGQGQ